LPIRELRWSDPDVSKGDPDVSKGKEKGGPEAAFFMRRDVSYCPNW